MNSTTIRYKMLVPALLVSGLGWFGSANAQTTVYLCAGPFDRTMEPAGVTMWGYAIEESGTTGACIGASSPGPEIVVPPGGSPLTIVLRNTLSEPTSLIIPGQSAAMTPVFNAGRVQSFTHEAPAGGSAASYTWTLKPGTYAYQSGTHPAVQVQMGLYGAMTNDAAAGEAYAGVSYDAQVTLLYSEIDPGMHADIVAGDVGVIGGNIGNTDNVKSTINYAPRYFLVNGEVYNGSNHTYTISAPGERTLIRFINMGLKMHVPTINGARVQVVAEDGYVYPDYRNQYSVQLGAGKTRDAIMSVSADAAGATFAVYDRMLNLSNDGALGAGGMMSFLAVGTGVTPPTADDDDYLGVEGAIEDTPFVVLTPGVLGNDSIGAGNPGPLTASLVSGAAYGGVSLNADGSFTYTPDPDFFGSDSFTYAANDGGGSATATATIDVTNVNDAPVAVNDDYTATEDTPLSIAAALGVLDNDTDVDGDTLTAVWDAGPADGSLVLNGDGSFDYTPNTGYTGPDSFTYYANDGLVDSASPATVSITVTAAVNEAPVAIDDFDSVARNGSVTIFVYSNDSDPDGNSDPALALDLMSIVITTQPDDTRGSAVANTDGSVTFTSENLRRPGKQPRKGTASFTYTIEDIAGETSNEATVRVNVN